MLCGGSKLYQEYILRSWSLLKLEPLQLKEKLFFNLKKNKNQIAPQSEGDYKG
jgi:RNA polymerase sigma-32 factor